MKKGKLTVNENVVSFCECRSETTVGDSYCKYNIFLVIFRRHVCIGSLGRVMIFER